MMVLYPTGKKCSPQDLNPALGTASVLNLASSFQAQVVDCIEKSSHSTDSLGSLPHDGGFFLT